MASILVVDDEAAICELLQRALSRCGHTVYTATGGQAGVALFQQHHPQITLLALRMADMNGLEVLKRIQSRGPSPAVVAMTTKGTEALVSQARRLGVTDFLNKEWLYRGLLNVRDKAEEPRPSPATGAPEQALVLVVDDEPMIRSLLKQFIELSGHRVQEAKNGPEALALVQQSRPQMIVLDMYMPGMTGVEVLYRLSNRDAVIMLTASQDESLLQEALDLGLVALIGKPVDLDRLEVAIQVGLAVQGP